MLTNQKGRFFRKAMALLLSFIMLYSAGNTNGWIAFAEDLGRDMTTSVKNQAITVKQDGADIGNGGTVSDALPIDVNLTFSAPIWEGENLENQVIQYNDYVIFDLAQNMEVEGKSVELFTAETEPRKIGNVSFLTAEDGTVKIRVDFNGDASIFDYTQGGIDSINCDIRCSLIYNGQGNEDGTITIKILDQEFTLALAPPAKEVALAKEGVVNYETQSITWTTEATGKQTQKGTSSELPLTGYAYTEDLTEVGTYVADSFQIDGVKVTPEMTENGIRYLFPEGSLAKHSISFETKIPDEQFFTNKEQAITSEGKLVDADTVELAKADATVTFQQNWISKKGQSNNGSSNQSKPLTDRYITWVITANEQNANLTNVKISDPLPGDLEFVSAVLKVYDRAGNATTSEIAELPSGGVFDVGTVEGKIELTIKTKVPDKKVIDTQVVYTNKATITWEGQNSGITANWHVYLGNNTVTKRIVDYDAKTGTFFWEVTVDAQNVATNDLMVYDILSHEKGHFPHADFKNGNIKGWPEALKEMDMSKVAQNARLRYYADEALQQDEGVELEVIPLISTKGGAKGATADLLVMSGKDGAGIPKDKAYTFRFKTQFTDPMVYADAGKIMLGTTGKPLGNSYLVRNEAHAFVGVEKVGTSNDYRGHESKMLLQDAIPVDVAEKIKADPTKASMSDVNTKAGKETEVFNYVDKDVLFRFHINAPGVDISTVVKGILSGEGTDSQAGKIYLEEMLPTGWELKAFDNGQNVALFSGEGKMATGEVTATAVADATMCHTEFTNEMGKVNFDKLDQSYVLLLLAGPTKEKAEEMFKKSETYTLTNNATLSTENWGALISANQPVIINSKVLGKSAELVEAGLVKWTVDYMPANLQFKETYIEDQLPEGLEVALDTDGNPALVGENYTLTELTLKADGTYQVGEALTLSVGEGGNLSYDFDNRVLRLDSKDAATGYRFTYLTTVTGEPGEVTNKVTLSGKELTGVETNGKYTITAEDVKVTLGRSGSIQINKVDTENKPLTGAIFTIFQEDGETSYRQGETDENGIFVFRGLKTGSYVLKETKAPDGYALGTKAYKVTVAGNMVTIDEKESVANAVLTVENKLAGQVGALTIHKTVVSATPETRQFNFTLTLTDENDTPLEGKFPYSRGDAPQGTIGHGDTFLLGHGESIAITELPENARYTITEDNYAAENFTLTSSVGSTGTIATTQASVAQFVNTRGTTTDIVPGGPPSQDTGDGNTVTIPTTDVPNAEAPDSPEEFVLIDEDGVPLANFTKTEQPDGSFVYINEEGVPLGEFLADIPLTGDQANVPLMALIAVGSLAGFFAIGRKKKENK